MNKAATEAAGVPDRNTKEKILRVSLRLFAMHGYEAVSVKDIADALGMSKSVLYKHYRGKRDVFDSIVAAMEKADLTRAEAFEMPLLAPDENPDEYRKASLQNVLKYTRAQFFYWTEDAFASCFRKMLTLEQYKDPEMAALYQQYLCEGPMRYMRGVFFAMTGNEQSADAAALSFYAPVYMLYSLSDSGMEKSELLALLDGHLKLFEENTKLKREKTNGI